MELQDKLKTVELVLTYGNMLTKKQLSAVTCYYLYDMALTEIAETENISRQGAYDLVSKSTLLLNDMEEKLGIIKLKKEIKSALVDLETTGLTKTQKQKILDLKLLVE